MVWNPSLATVWNHVEDVNGITRQRVFPSLATAWNHVKDVNGITRQRVSPSA
ncbi:MAG: hypothetical protein IIX67_01670 [Clostridia bacterium]|nr:hypothetical protein [Clostridia bacterium]